MYEKYFFLFYFLKDPFDLERKTIFTDENKLSNDEYLGCVMSLVLFDVFSLMKHI